ncbi:MAG: bifunctional UDP-N-acetylglucosamine diphosphorylase/glucosamine-1-phosphate N-acetyltransferase GlmU [Thermoanaerobaculia bacterium]
METKVLILAAGQGKRMKSSFPKVLHKLCGKPLLSYVIDTAKALNPEEIYVILAYGKEKVIEVLPEGVKSIDQGSPLGTGHAVKVALENIEKSKGVLLVLSGDVPLIKKETLEKFYENFKKDKADLSFISVSLENPGNYGRVLRGRKGKILKIKEARDCSKKELKIKEINTGIYLFKIEKIKPLLSKIKNKNAQKEYYLTDLVEMAVKNKLKVNSYIYPTFFEFSGVNSREELAILGKYLYRKKAEELMESGVTIFDPENTYINPDVEVGEDTEIYPGVYLENCKIGKECVIFPNSFIINSKIDDGTVIYPYSMIENSIIGKKCKVGPSAHLRAETILKDEVRLGNFVETKKATLGKGTKAAHLTYLGDAIIGENVNIGCGTITCNYDGIRKHQTIIEDGAFIGSDCQLVAPVKVGKNAYTASGTTVTDDVPEYSLAISRVPQKNVINWVKRRSKK